MERPSLVPITTIGVAQIIISSSLAIWWRKGHLPIDYCSTKTTHHSWSLIHYSSFTRLKCVTAWIFNNCRAVKSKQSKVSQSKSLGQLKTMEFWFHRKTISRRKFTLSLPTKHCLLKVVCCRFTPSLTLLLRVSSREQIPICRIPIYTLWSFTESILWQSSWYALNIYDCCMAFSHSSSPHFVIVCTSLVVTRLFALLLVHAPSVIATQQSPNLRCWDNFLLSVLFLTAYIWECLRGLCWAILHHMNLCVSQPLSNLMQAFMSLCPWKQFT